MIPGSNLLSVALRVIAPTKVNYYPFKSRTLNDIGVYVSSYEIPQIVYGSFQAVPRSIYTQMGLDFSKQYYMFYASANMQNLNRGNAGDKLVIGSKSFEVMSNTDWYEIDGWNGIMCVLINNEAS